MNRIVSLLAALEIMDGKNLKEIGRVFTEKLKVIAEEINGVEKQITGKD